MCKNVVRSRLLVNPNGVTPPSFQSLDGATASSHDTGISSHNRSVQKCVSAIQAKTNCSV